MEINVWDIINQYVLPFALGFSVVSFYVVYVKNVLKEVSDVLVTIVNMVEDNNITADELTELVAQCKQVIDVAKKWKK